MSKASTEMEATSSMSLFNNINQSKPTFAVDLRDENAFNQCHLREAVRIDIGDCLLEEKFLEKMSPISNKNKLSILFLADASVNKEVVQRVISRINGFVTVAKETNETNKSNEEANQADGEALPKSRWSTIISVLWVDFDVFRASYPNCASLFLGSDFPHESKKKSPPKMYPTEVIAGFVYLGNYYDASDEVKMRDLRITHIVDATGANLAQKNAEKLNIAYLPVHVWDMEGVDIFQHYETVLQFILAAKEASEGKILIHCRAGISRSATFVLAYLMYCGNCPSLKAALELVVPERPYVLPNKSFRAQLLDYEESLFGTRSFADDNAFLSCVSSMNFCWSGMFSLENDHDKVPIIAASQRINVAKYLEEFPSDGAEKAVQAKPKKSFLKRGEGKNTANLKAGVGPTSRTETDGSGSAVGTTVTADRPVVREKLGYYLAAQRALQAHKTLETCSEEVLGPTSSADTGATAVKVLRGLSIDHTVIADGGATVLVV